MNSLLKHAMFLVLLTSAPSEDVSKQVQDCSHEFCPHLTLLLSEGPTLLVSFFPECLF
jgi:hypothetical protein